jgi:hypothetical protein
MKFQFVHSVRPGSIRWFLLATAISWLGFDSLLQTAVAQAPGLLWTTDVGARLFAVDDQTNLYANLGGKVIVLSSAGVPLGTNTICPLKGVAQRDSSGNFYFAGNFDGTQDFGGITLVGGWTQGSPSPPWTAGWPTCYLAKYSSNGSLLWAESFGEQASVNMLSDLLIDPAGGCYAAFSTSIGDAIISHFSNSGSNDQSANVFSGELITFVYPGFSLGGVTSSNICFFADRKALAQQLILAGRLDTNGSVTYLGQFPLQWPVPEMTNSKPVTDSLGQVFEVGLCFNPGPDPSCTNQLLRKCGSGTSELWSEPISPEVQWTLATDSQSNVYVAGTNGMLAMFDSDGTLVWSNNFTQPIFGMIVDRNSNRFVSFANGMVGRLGSGQTIPSGQVLLTADRQGLSPSGFSFNLTSDPQLVWQILGSSNLTSWQFVGNATNSSGQIQFTDPASPRGPVRFYKALRQQ